MAFATFVVALKLDETLCTMMLKLGVVLFALVAAGEGVVIALNAGKLKEQTALEASDQLRRHMCVSIKGELESLKHSL